MGLNYRADVFFGTFVEKTTPLGKRLNKYVDKADGTPAETEAPGVEIDMTGSQSSGEIWMVIMATGSGMSFGREDDIEAPSALTEEPQWRPAIEAFIATLPASAKFKTPLPPIGWHFAGSVL